jgi:hypothetical protein
MPRRREISIELSVRSVYSLRTLEEDIVPCYWSRVQSPRPVAGLVFGEPFRQARRDGSQKTDSDSAKAANQLNPESRDQAAAAGISWSTRFRGAPATTPAARDEAIPTAIETGQKDSRNKLPIQESRLVCIPLAASPPYQSIAG